jgi:biopolymer transport protein ExbB/TolQ
MDWKFIIFSGGPIVLILFLLLIIVLILIVERILYYKNYKNLLNYMEQILQTNDKISINDFKNKIWEFNPAISSNWIKFLNHLEETNIDEKKYNELFNQFYQKETLILERYLIYLATLGNLSPFIGLLGTVFGIIRSFMHLGETNIVEINRGIAEALIATAIGLIVAIPSSFGYNLFRRSIEEIEINLNLIHAMLENKIHDEK